MVEWFRQKETLKLNPVPLPAVGRDTFYYPRLLQPGLESFQDGAATTSPGNLCQGLLTLTGKDFFPNI